jgi:invasion protein IalB
MYLEQYLSLFSLIFWSFAANASEAIEAKHPNYEAHATHASRASLGEITHFEKWTAATVQEEGHLICVVASATLAGDGSLALIFLSIRPNEHVVGQLGVHFDSEAADKGAPGKAEVDGQTFELAGMGRSRWISQLSDQQRLLKALSKGDVLTITMPKLSGAENVFAYPLPGFSDAWNFAETKCSAGLT